MVLIFPGVHLPQIPIFLQCSLAPMSIIGPKVPIMLQSAHLPQIPLCSGAHVSWCPFSPSAHLPAMPTCPYAHRSQKFLFVQLNAPNTRLRR